MKNLGQVLKDWEFKCKDFDGRDVLRIAQYLPEDRLPELDMSVQEGHEGTWKTKDWTLDNILEDLNRDVKFAYEKAVDHRGISSELMFYVVCMWLWILEDEGAPIPPEHYTDYGLSFFEEVADHYKISLSEDGE